MTRRRLWAVLVLAGLGTAGCTSGGTHSSAAPAPAHSSPQLVGPAPGSSSTPESSGSSSTPASPGSSNTGSSSTPASSGAATPGSSGASSTSSSGGAPPPAALAAVRQFLPLYLDYDWSTWSEQEPQVRQQLQALASPAVVQLWVQQHTGAPGQVLEQNQEQVSALVQSVQPSPAQPDQIFALVQVTLLSRGQLAPQTQSQEWQVQVAPGAGGTWVVQSAQQRLVY